ncbi:hypothetical protein I552_5294 [Mycobacterium xenopi 3993]|nr:hypothetical protein I552_5294 [Mycobacterium xenopi 3993]
MFGLLPAIGAALGTAALVLLWRLVRRESTQPAVAGFFGSLAARCLPTRSGIEGLLFAGHLDLAAVGGDLRGVGADPTAAGRLPVELGERAGPRLARVRRAVLAFDAATLAWVLVFGARFVVQRLLYDADQTGWLGVARIAMGWPLSVAAAMATYAAIKAAQRAMRPAQAGVPAAAADATPPPPR